jgi:hypothetical protein
MCKQATLSIHLPRSFVEDGRHAHHFGMKEHSADDNGANDDEHDDGLGIMNQVSFTPSKSAASPRESSHSKTSEESGAADSGSSFDDEAFKPNLGVVSRLKELSMRGRNGEILGNYHLNDERRGRRLRI